MKRRNCCAGAGVLRYQQQHNRKTIGRIYLRAAPPPGRYRLRRPGLAVRKRTASIRCRCGPFAAQNSPLDCFARLRRSPLTLPERCMNGSSRVAKNTQIFSLTLNPARGLLSSLAGGTISVETFAMFRAPIIAALTVALLGGTAMAQPANAPPANLSGRNAPDYDDDQGYSPSARPADRGYADAPPPAAGAYDNSQRAPSAAQQAQADRDIFCRRDAAARTGYTTPGEAATNILCNSGTRMPVLAPGAVVMVCSASM